MNRYRGTILCKVKESWGKFNRATTKEGLELVYSNLLIYLTSMMINLKYENLLLQFEMI